MVEQVPLEAFLENWQAYTKCFNVCLRIGICLQLNGMYVVDSCLSATLYFTATCKRNVGLYVAE